MQNVPDSRYAGGGTPPLRYENRIFLKSFDRPARMKHRQKTDEAVLGLCTDKARFLLLYHFFEFVFVYDSYSQLVCFSQLTARILAC